MVDGIEVEIARMEGRAGEMDVKLSYHADI